MTQRDEALEILPDWELLVRLNALLPRLAGAAIPAPTDAATAGAAADDLLSALRGAMPKSAEIFRRPVARSEVLLMPIT